MNAIFTSRLDYCNYLLAGLIVQDVTRLQRWARLVLVVVTRQEVTNCELFHIILRKNKNDFIS